MSAWQWVAAIIGGSLVAGLVLGFVISRKFGDANDIIGPDHDMGTRP